MCLTYTILFYRRFKTLSNGYRMNGTPYQTTSLHEVYNVKSLSSISRSLSLRKATLVTLKYKCKRNSCNNNYIIKFLPILCIHIILCLIFGVFACPIIIIITCLICPISRCVIAWFRLSKWCTVSSTCVTISRRTGAYSCMNFLISFYG